jgi:hypothetical protein
VFVSGPSVSRWSVVVACFLSGKDTTKSTAHAYQIFSSRPPWAKVLHTPGYTPTHIHSYLQHTLSNPLLQSLPDHLPYCSIDELFPALFVALLNCCVLFFSPFSPIIVYYCSILAYYSGSIDELPLLFLSRYLIVVHICSPPILCQETLRIVSPPYQPFVKTFSGIVKGLLAAQLCTVTGLFLSGVSQPVCYGPILQNPSLQPATLFHLRGSAFHKGLHRSFCHVLLNCCEICGWLNWVSSPPFCGAHNSLAKPPGISYSWPQPVSHSLNTEQLNITTLDQ